MIRLKVLLITEGTYPFHWGGVSTWCHSILRALQEVNFTLMSLVSDPRAQLLYKLPPNVTEFRPVALWGVHQVMETMPGLGLGEVLRRYGQTTERLVADEFVPLFRSFLAEIFAENGEPDRLARSIHRMHRFFVAYDFDRTLRSKAVWACFVQTAQELYPRTAAGHGYPDADFRLSDITKGMQWLYHIFFPIAQPLPQADIAHAAMAGTCTLVAVCLKLEQGAAYLLTEHGIYLRECYLAEAATSDSLFLKLFRLRFARRMTELSYAMADQISPCCDYNKRWELRLGADPDRLKTIYYGVDSTEFSPAGKVVGKSPAVVVWVGRINPLKDLRALLHAAAIVHGGRPDVQFRFYGSAAPEDEPYHQDMLALRASLGLNEVVVFGGYVAKPAAAFNEGDVVVLSSISEAFPFSVLEAMLCAKPVVATGVGGVPEEIEGCGIVVEPRNPKAMAEAILELMNDPERCTALGKAARVRAEQEFSVGQTKHAHLSSYLDLMRKRGQSSGPWAGPPAAPLYREGLPKEFAGCRIGNNGFTIGQWREGDAAVCHAWGSRCSPRLAVAPPREHHGTVIRRLAAMEAENSQGILALAAEVSQHVRHPLDALEIAALIESLGVTDEAALRRYGAADIFELAETILDCVRLLVANESEESQGLSIPTQVTSA